VYRVRRDSNRIEVIQNGEIVYSGSSEEYLVFKESEDAKKYSVKRINELTDPELLLALATAIRLPTMVRKDSNS